MFKDEFELIARREGKGREDLWNFEEIGLLVSNERYSRIFMSHRDI